MPETANNLKAGAAGSGASPATAQGYHYTGAIQSPSILVYTDDYYQSSGSTYVEQALQRLGYSFTAFYGNYSGFGAALAGSSWDLVIVSHDTYFELGTYWSELEAYFNGGGKLLIATFDVDGSNSETTTLWSTLGLSFVGAPSGAAIYSWASGHAVWAGVPNFTSITQDYGDEGDRIDVLSSATALGGYTASAGAGQAAIMVRNDPAPSWTASSWTKIVPILTVTA